MAEQIKQIDFPKEYYLTSVTMLIDGNRVFADIPMFSHRLIFPNRNVIFKFACSRFGIAVTYPYAKDTFAVLSIFKFANEEDYQSYISVPDEGQQNS